MGNFQQQQLNLIIATLANGKMIDELDQQVIITNSDTTLAINDGGDNAKKASIDKIRGFLGDWNALTNIPTLSDGLGVAGDMYKVSATSTIDLGSGILDLQAGDFVMYDGAQWNKLTSKSSSMNKVNKYTLAITDDAGESNFIIPGKPLYILPIKNGFPLMEGAPPLQFTYDPVTAQMVLKDDVFPSDVLEVVTINEAGAIETVITTAVDQEEVPFTGTAGLLLVLKDGGWQMENIHFTRTILSSGNSITFNEGQPIGTRITFIKL